jgi:glycerol-3-phosphate dehydrogenase
VISIAGGKLSAYRAMAERIVDKVAGRLETKLPACSTETALLPGGDAVPADVVAALVGRGFAADEAQRLVGLYGAEATDFAASGDIVTTEVTFAVAREAACRLEDWWARRSARAWFDAGAGLPTLPAAAAAMAALLGWTDAERNAEIENCRAIDAASRTEFAALAREQAA